MTFSTPQNEKSCAFKIQGLHHAYGTRKALEDVTLSVHQGEVFGVLGENGCGKTTLFKILSTLMPPSSGQVSLLGHDLVEKPKSIRRRIGVVFQHPSLDPKLTVRENLVHQARLYGMRGKILKESVKKNLDRLGISDRSNDLAENLSGGLQRRAELAKALLHRPDILILDEPGTGLDPAARKTFDDYLEDLRQTESTTVLMTTHLLEQADRCDRVAFLHRGALVALGTPDDLKLRVGGDVVRIQSRDSEGLRLRILERFGLEARLVLGELRIERPRGHELVRNLVDAFPDEVGSITFGKPTLEDVFIHVTGHTMFKDQDDDNKESRKQKP